VKPIRRLSLAEQTAAHLRDGLRARRWGDTLPGVLRLATECQVSKDTIRSALRLLEAEGLLAGRGRGRGRAIAGAGARRDGGKRLRVGVLTHVRLEDESGVTLRLLLQLRHDIEVAGHVCVFSSEPQSRLRGDLRRLARVVDKAHADAWLVVSGSLDVLTWFAARPVPAIAIGGRRGILPAGVGMDGAAAFGEATRRLIALGHRRIVFVCPGEWRLPVPGRIVEIFRRELSAHAIPAGDYHVPDWTETSAGFQALLTSLFRVTPPTALIVDESSRAIAALAFLAQRRLRVPQDVSLVTLNLSPSLTWCQPPFAHFRCEVTPIIRHVVRWLAGAERGAAPGTQLDCPLAFDPGGSIAAAAES
jgi:DNA-binding LacI/PurR family transcriptional regulator